MRWKPYDASDDKGMRVGIRDYYLIHNCIPVQLTLLKSSSVQFKYSGETAHEADASVTLDQQKHLHEKTEKYKHGLQKVWKIAVSKMQEKQINRLYLKFK